MVNENELSSIKDSFAEWIGIKTICGYKEFVSNTDEWKEHQKLEKATSRFIQMRELLNKHPNIINELNTLFNELASIEPTLEKILEPTSEIEEETYSELLFTGQHTKPLNFVPFFLTFWSFFKIYLIPSMSFIIPLLLFITPYIVAKYILKIPLNINRYFNILVKILSRDIQSMQGVYFDTDKSILSSGFHIILTIMPIIQAVILPYWSFKHLKSVDNIINDHGHVISKLRNIYEQLETILKAHGFNIHKNPMAFLDNRQSVANSLTNKFQYLYSLKILGRIEVIYRLSSNKSICPVKWVNSTTPICNIDSTFDHQIPEDKCIPFSIDLHKQGHSILTGPNMGGKSSILRAVANNVLIAHTYGCAIGKSCTMTPLKSMFLCLKPDDIPGKKSRFEREVDFTSNIIKNKKGFNIVLIDELFHSTNPPDAFYSSQVFCNKLWKDNETLSIISTHLFDLLEHEDAKNVKKLCCMAEECGNDIIFSYKLVPGVCKVSSVRKILKDYNL